MTTAVAEPTDTVTLGDKRVETSNFDRYKGRKGVTDRVAIISKGLVRAYNYFYEGSNRKMTFRAPRDKELLEKVRAQLGEPQQKFGLALFHYQTDEQGNLLDDTKLSGKVKVWAVSETRYEELSALHRSWPLLDGGFSEPQVDLMIKCTEEQFQRMNFTPCPSAHWKKKDSWYAALKDKERKAADKVKMALGRQMSDREIMELLGMSVPASAPTQGGSGDIDLSDVIDDDGI